MVIQDATQIGLDGEPASVHLPLRRRDLRHLYRNGYGSLAQSISVIPKLGLALALMNNPLPGAKVLELMHKLVGQGPSARAAAQGIGLLGYWLCPRIPPLSQNRRSCLLIVKEQE